MKFIYQYRTSDNIEHRGEIDARDRDAAYAALKAQSIKPSRLWEKPGIFNKLFGKGKRWIAIGALTLVACALALAWTRAYIERARAADESNYDERAQLYGDPVVIAECEDALWTNVFTTAFDQHLARYAIPGRVLTNAVDMASLQPNLEDALRIVAISDDDLAEVAQMKRMVNGIKRELREYIADGGNLNGYLKRLDIRQRAERGIFETTQRLILKSKDHTIWREKNAELRAMGLPMVATEPTDD